MHPDSTRANHSELWPRLEALAVALFGFAELEVLGLEEMAVWFVPPVVASSKDGGVESGGGD